MNISNSTPQTGLSINTTDQAVRSRNTGKEADKAGQAESRSAAGRADSISISEEARERAAHLKDSDDK